MVRADASPPSTSRAGLCLSYWPRRLTQARHRLSVGGRRAARGGRSGRGRDLARFLVGGQPRSSPCSTRTGRPLTAGAGCELPDEESYASGPLARRGRGRRWRRRRLRRGRPARGGLRRRRARLADRRRRRRQAGGRLWPTIASTAEMATTGCWATAAPTRPTVAKVLHCIELRLYRLTAPAVAPAATSRRRRGARLSLDFACGRPPASACRARAAAAVASCRCPASPAPPSTAASCPTCSS